MTLMSKLINAMERQRPLCPDCRDKAKGYNCLLCEIKKLKQIVEELQDRIIDLETDRRRCEDDY